MKTIGEILIENEIKFTDSKYINHLNGLKICAERNGLQETQVYKKLVRKIHAIKEISSGKSRKQIPYLS
jgi:hypothetical protein